MYGHMFLDEFEGHLNVDNMKADPVAALLDNRSAIDIGAWHKDMKHARHIMHHYHYVREDIMNGQHLVIWIGTKFQLADLATKALPVTIIAFLLKYMMVNVREEGLAQEGL